jgi:hypothetical protein
METLKAKIEELLGMNNIEPIYDFAERGKNPNSLVNIMERQETLIDELRVLARKHCTVLGREIKFPAADSYAIYVVTKVGDQKSEVTWVRWCDTHYDDRLGLKGTLDTSFIMEKVRGEDRLEKLFPRKARTH